MNPFHLAAVIDGNLRFLAGPRTPEKVQRDGYGFTADPAAAWGFDTEAQAYEKARAVAQHMGWPAGRFTLVNLNAFIP